ncbi:MAG TPA: hypothetical protein VNA25_05070 [Phycisphaerae bacterium]|nr:hypothetical protein [Phycisphaerae bacterium]
MTIIEILAALDKATRFVVSAFDADACAALDTAITELAEARAILPADWEQQLRAVEAERDGAIKLLALMWRYDPSPSIPECQGGE